MFVSCFLGRVKGKGRGLGERRYFFFGYQFVGRFWVFGLGVVVVCPLVFIFFFECVLCSGSFLFGGVFFVEG